MKYRTSLCRLLLVAVSSCTGLVFVVFLLLLYQEEIQERRIEPLAHYVTKGMAKAMVVDRVGILNGHSVSFAYKPMSETNWFNYYLDHDSFRWRNVEINEFAGMLIVSKNKRTVALFDTASCVMWHSSLSHVFTNALDEGSSWNKVSHDHLWIEGDVGSSQ